MKTELLLSYIGWTVSIFFVLFQYLYLPHVVQLWQKESMIEHVKQSDERLVSPVLQYNEHHWSDKEVVMWRMHIVGATVWWSLSSLQLSNWIRKKSLKVHRWTGRVAVTGALIQLLSGVHATFYTKYGFSFAVATLLYSVVFAICLYKTYKYAVQKDIYNHSLWALKLYIMALVILAARIPIGYFLFIRTEEIVGDPTLQEDIGAFSFWGSFVLACLICEPVARLAHPRFIKTKTSVTKQNVIVNKKGE